MKKGPALIPDFAEHPTSAKVMPGYAALRGALYRARSFVLDEAATDHVMRLGLNREIHDSILEASNGDPQADIDWRADPVIQMAEFARAPFEPCYVQFHIPGEWTTATDGIFPEQEGHPWPVGLLVHEGYVYLVRGRAPDRTCPKLHWVFDPAYRGLHWTDGMIRCSVIDPGGLFDVDTHIRDAGRTVMQLHRMLVSFFLLLHQPKAVSTEETVSRRVGVQGGKRKVYLARSSVSINLGASLPGRKSFRVDDRASPRRHVVRGSWVHRALDPECTHSWEREPLPGKPDRVRYRCSKCRATRSWRDSHYRGDAGSGFSAREPYVVTHKES